MPYRNHLVEQSAQLTCERINRHVANHGGNQLNTSFEHFGKNALSIVTFNYDRVVEYFFFTSLKNSYGKDDRECAAVLDKIPIVHLHGRLGYLPWQNVNAKSRPFQPIVDGRALHISVDNLKIIHEDISGEQDQDFKTARRLLSEAQHVYLMGF